MKKTEYEDISIFSEGLAPVRRGGRWGFIDMDGREVIPCVYEYVSPFENGTARVALREGTWNPYKHRMQGGRWGVIDRTGEFTILPAYNTVSYFSDGAAVCSDRYGVHFFIDTEGKRLFDEGFAYAVNFRNGLAQVERCGMWGMIDRQGNMVVPMKYEGIDWVETHDGVSYAGACRNGRWGVIDGKGNTLIDFVYEDLRCATGGLIEIGRPANRFNSKKGVISLSGHTILDCVYDDVYCAPQAIAVNLGQKETARSLYSGKWGWADINGNIIVDPRYSNESGIFFSEGLAEVTWRGKTGFADITGEVVIPFRYDFALGFLDGMSLVVSKGKHGFIDRNGEVVIPMEYDFLTVFSEGYAVARHKGELFYIDTCGRRRIL